MRYLPPYLLVKLQFVVLLGLPLSPHLTAVTAAGTVVLVIDVITDTDWLEESIPDRKRLKNRTEKQKKLKRTSETTRGDRTSAPNTRDSSENKRIVHKNK